MTTRRVATVLVGVAVVLIGHFVGGYPGAGVIGLGIAVAVVGVGRREPHLFKRWRGEDPDAPDPPEGEAAPRRWPEW